MAEVAGRLEGSGSCVAGVRVARRAARSGIVSVAACRGIMIRVRMADVADAIKGGSTFCIARTRCEGHE